MKIISLSAQNFMKYSLLEIPAFPPSGVIGIFGENESGKSTIGDAISFALFGQTPRGNDGCVSPPVKWGASGCEVRLAFSTGTDVFTIERSASKTQAPKARVADEAGSTVASGWSEASDFIVRSLGLDFRGFRHTSMLCQKELDIMRSRPDERRAVVDSLLGTGTIDRALTLAVDRVSSLKSSQEKLTSILNRVRQAVETVDAELISEPEYLSRISSLESRLSEVEDCASQRRARADSIETAIEIRERYLQANDRLLEQRASISELDAETASVTGTLRELSEAAFDMGDGDPDRLMANAESCIEREATGLSVLKERLRGISKARDTMTEIDALGKLLRVRQDSLAIIEEQIAEGRRYQAEIEYCEGCLRTMREKREARNIERANRLQALAGEGIAARDALESGRAALAKKISEIASRKVSLENEIIALEREICLSGEKELRVSKLGEMNASIQKYHGISLVSSMLMILTLVGAIIAGLRNGGPWWGLLVVPALLLWVTYRASSSKKGKLMEKQGLSARIREAEEEWKSRISGIQNQLAATEADAETLAATSVFLENLDLSGPAALGNALQTIADQLLNPVGGPGSCLPFGGEFLPANFAETLEEILVRCRSLGIEDHPSWESAASSEAPRDEVEEEREASMASRLDSMASKLADPATLLSKAETLRAEIGETGRRIEELTDWMEPYDSMDLAEAEAETEERIESTERRLSRMKETFLSMQYHHGKIQETSRKTAEARGRADFFVSKRNSVAAEWEAAGISQQEGLATKREDLSEARDLFAQSEEERLRLCREISRLRGETARFGDARARRDNLGAEAASTEAELAAVQMELRAMPEVSSGFEETRATLETSLMERVASAAGEILGRITGDRYREVRLDREMGVRVFSPDRKDFVPANSLSGGTEDQALLALRLGFARVLLPSGAAGFLFLDEPLASFDERRRGSFIEFVKYLESSFGQVFLISHLRGLEKYMDTHVFLSRNAETVTPGPLAP